MKKKYAMPGIEIRQVEMEKVVAASCVIDTGVTGVQDWDDGVIQGSGDGDITIF